MSDIEFLLGLAVENQTARGTATAMPAIGAGSGTAGAIDETDGAILGVDGTGAGDSGISFSLGKSLSEKAVITGSFTRNFANVLGRTVDSFQVVTPLKGSGTTGSNPLVGADFEIAAGLQALWRAAGFGETSSGSGQLFQPTPTALITAAIFFGNESSNGGQIIIRDVEARSLTIGLTPGEAGTLTWDLLGEFDSYNESGSWPAAPFEYGNQATLSAPVVENCGFTWGPDAPGAREIGFSDLAITISNVFETVPSSNAPGGRTQRQTGRTVSITGTIDATDGEFLYELDQLGEGDIANAESLLLTVGTAAVIGGTVNAFTVIASDPELVKLEPSRLGNSQAWTIELVARSSTANSEVSFVYA